MSPGVTTRLAVLVVEDDPADAAVARHAMQAARGLGVRFEVVEVETLAAAERMLASGRFDAVVMDLGLPDADRFEGLQRIRRSGRKVPVVVLTGESDERIGWACIRLGADEFVCKGDDDPGLARALVRAVLRRRGQQTDPNLVDFAAA